MKIKKAEARIITLTEKEIYDLNLNIACLIMIKSVCRDMLKIDNEVWYETFDYFIDNATMILDGKVEDKDENEEK